MFLDSIKSIDVNELDEILDDINLIDIREPYELEIEAIDGAENIPMGDLFHTPDEYLDKDKTYYLLCHSGMRSLKLSVLLSDLGYDVINVTGGIAAYRGSRRI